MMFLALINGASIIPLFIPLIPQVLILIFTIKFFDLNVIKYYYQILFYITIMVVILITSFASAALSDSESALKYFKLLINSIFSIGLASALIKVYGSDFRFFYVKYISIFVFMGIMGLMLVELFDWNVVKSISTREYHTNFLTTWLSDDGYNSSATTFSPFKYRLQSFFDEPGTFGVFVVPAFYQTLYSKNIKLTILLGVGIFLSESASAWVFSIMIIILQPFQTKASFKKILATLSILMLIAILSYDYILLLYNIKTGVDEAYANASSGESKMADFLFLYENYFNHIIPMQSNISLPGFSVSYVSWLLSSGWLFSLIILFSLILITHSLIVSRANSRSNGSFNFILLISIFFAGFQRSSFLDNIMFSTFFYWALMDSFFTRYLFVRGRVAQPLAVLR